MKNGLSVPGGSDNLPSRNSSDDKKQTGLSTERKNPSALEIPDAKPKHTGKPNDIKPVTLKAEEKPAPNERAFKILSIVIIAVQGLLSAFFAYQVISIRMLPTLYVVLIIAALAIILALNIFLLFGGKKGKGGLTLRRILAAALAIVVSVTSLFGSSVIADMRNALQQVTGETTTSVIANIGVYVLKDDPANAISDCKAYSFGRPLEAEAPKTAAAIEKINKELGSSITCTDYVTETEALTALYDGDIKALILDENRAAVLGDTEDFADFATETREIGMYEIVQEDVDSLPPTTASETSETTDETVPIEDMTNKVVDITKDPFILYVSGSDTRAKKFHISRSDVNILMVVNPQTHQILLVNTPRDYYVPNPRSKSGMKDKLTHLGLYGPNCSIKGLETLYSCDVNYYFQINFTGLTKFIDEIGGVTVNNPIAFSGYGFKYKKGKITLDGKMALGYARERKRVSGGDHTRGKNQMRIIKAVVKKFTSPDTKLLKNYKNVLNALSGLMRTSVTEEELEAVVKMQLENKESWTIKTYAVDGTGDSEKTYSAPSHRAYVMRPNQKKVDEASAMIQKVLAGQSLDEETPASSETSATGTSN